MRKKVLQRTIYNIVCGSCGNIVFTDGLGEYPYSWQIAICEKCNGIASPDLEHPIDNSIYTEIPDEQ